jgi:hypothetical protein
MQMCKSFPDEMQDFATLPVQFVLRWNFRVSAQASVSEVWALSPNARDFRQREMQARTV